VNAEFQWATPEWAAGGLFPTALRYPFRFERAGRKPCVVYSVFKRFWVVGLFKFYRFHFAAFVGLL
jgi:hypothetical protein